MFVKYDSSVSSLHPSPSVSCVILAVVVLVSVKPSLSATVSDIVYEPDVL